MGKPPSVTLTAAEIARLAVFTTSLARLTPITRIGVRRELTGIAYAIVDGGSSVHRLTPRADG